MPTTASPSSGDRPSGAPTTPATSATAAPAAPQEVAVQIVLGETVIDASLGTSPAARELAGRLPLTLTFTDFNQVEKIARLPRELPMDGMPAGDDPSPGDIGYYAPTGDLVLYYGDVGYYDGIARLGQMDRTAPIETLDQDFTATIALRD